MDLVVVARLTMHARKAMGQDAASHVTGQILVVAFTCKRRGICLSCMARGMAEAERDEGDNRGRGGSPRGVAVATMATSVWRSGIARQARR
jgi:hypothetical protein